MRGSFYWLIVGTLVVWRVTHLLQAEDGPWNVIVILRRWAGSSVFGDLMDCFYCLSLWVAAPVAYGISPTWIECLWLWPTLSGAAILLERITQRPPASFIGTQLGESEDVMLRQEPSAGRPNVPG